MGLFFYKGKRGMAYRLLIVLYIIKTNENETVKYNIKHNGNIGFNTRICLHRNISKIN